MSRSGTPALVVNRGEGTVSVLKLGASPVAEIAKVALGKADTRSRGIDFTPDGQHLAGVVMNGSNKARNNAFYADMGLLQIWRVGDAAQRPVKVAE
ncbi:MAG: hypothetical protein Q8L92_16460, partial [Rubrivivax sp.]|nr:hypothetical protein [Rubrivivax sp.]